jgi:phage terminase large subunit GpA-like protein
MPARQQGMIRKSKQIGATTLAIAAIGYTIAVEPCDLFLIEPTDSNLSDFQALKLQPTIEATPALTEKVKPQRRARARARRRAQALCRRLAVAGDREFVAELRGKTRKKVIRDEASEYADDLGGQGSPHDMIAGAYETFLAGGDWKDLWISTPTIKGACAIERRIRGRRPALSGSCLPGLRDGAFVFKFDRKHFVFNETFPLQGALRGAVLRLDDRLLAAHARWCRRGRVSAGSRPRRRRASAPIISTRCPRRSCRGTRSRAIFVEAGDNPTKLKTFDNLTLGLAYEVKGDAPDYERLLERREDYPAARFRRAGLLLVAGADVQHSGIWFEVVAYASNGESWSIEHDFLEGETTDHKAGAFEKLAEVYDRSFPDAFGGTRPIDCMAIDAGDGGRSNQVYDSGRGRARAFAIKGVPGWTRRRSARRRRSTSSCREKGQGRRHALAGRHLVAQGDVLLQPGQGWPQGRRRGRSRRLLPPPRRLRRAFFQAANRRIPQDPPLSAAAP